LRGTPAHSAILDDWQRGSIWCTWQRMRCHYKYRVRLLNDAHSSGNTCIARATRRWRLRIARNACAFDHPERLVARLDLVHLATHALPLQNVHND